VPDPITRKLTTNCRIKTVNSTRPADGAPDPSGHILGVVFESLLFLWTIWTREQTSGLGNIILFLATVISAFIVRISWRPELHLRRDDFRRGPDSLSLKALQDPGSSS
jgi:hypothetical protein